MASIGEKKRDLRIPFETNNTLGKFIINIKEKIYQNPNSGVHKLYCRSCPKVYVGHTRRYFQICFVEHSTVFNQEKTDTTRNI